MSWSPDIFDTIEVKKFARPNLGYLQLYLILSQIKISVIDSKKYFIILQPVIDPSSNIIITQISTVLKFFQSSEYIDSQGFVFRDYIAKSS